MAEAVPQSSAIQAAVEQEARFKDLEANVVALRVDAGRNQDETRGTLAAIRRENDAAHAAVMAEVKSLQADVAKALAWQVEHHNLHEEMPDLEEMEGNVSALMKASHDGRIKGSVWKMQAAFLGTGAGIAGSVIYALHIVGVI